MIFNSFPSCLMSKSQWRLPLTPPGVMSAPNRGMTIHTLVPPIDSFSCNCNSMNSSLAIDFEEHFSLSSSYCCVCINTSVFSNVIIQDFNFVQQCIQISTRINSSMYIRTSVFVSFETYPIFNNNLKVKGHTVKYWHLVQYHLLVMLITVWELVSF